MPPSTSPLPPLAMPGFPVVFTRTGPSGEAVSVRWPLSTRMQRCWRAKDRAAALEERVSELEKEIYHLKHELVAHQIRYDEGQN